MLALLQDHGCHAPMNTTDNNRLCSIFTFSSCTFMQTVNWCFGGASSETSSLIRGYYYYYSGSRSAFLCVGSALCTMFLSKLSSTRIRKHALPDLTLAKSIDNWHPGVLRVLHYHPDVVAIAYDPTLGLVAAGTQIGRHRVCAVCSGSSTGTTSGIIRIFGTPGVDVIIDLPEPVPVSILRISTSTRQLICVGESLPLRV